MPNSEVIIVWRDAAEIGAMFGVSAETVRRWSRERDPRIMRRPLPKKGKRYALTEQGLTALNYSSQESAAEAKAS